MLRFNGDGKIFTHFLKVKGKDQKEIDRQILE